MNQKKRRQRVARIRHQQKDSWLANRPQPTREPTLQELISSAEHNVKMSRKYVEDDKKGMSTAFKSILLAIPVYLALVISVLLSKTSNDAKLFVVSFLTCAMVVPVLPWYFVRKSMLLWCDMLKRDIEHLESLRRRIRINQTQIA